MNHQLLQDREGKVRYGKIKVKIKYPLLNYAPHHKDILGSGGTDPHTFSTSALDGGEFSASRSGHFIPRERPL